MTTVPTGGVPSGDVSDSARARSSCGVVRLVRGSTTARPPLTMRVMSWLADSAGNAARSTAAAPATCGVACEVPAMRKPAASISAPGASSLRNVALFEKHATRSAAVTGSVHTV